MSRQDVPTAPGLVRRISIRAPLPSLRPANALSASLPAFAIRFVDRFAGQPRPAQRTSSSEPAGSWVRRSASSFVEDCLGAANE